MSGAADDTARERIAHTLNTLIFSNCKQLLAHLHAYYFADNTYALHHTGFAVWGLWGLGLSLAMSFFTMSFGTIAAGFAFTGLALFSLGIVLHGVFWAAGHVYRHGFIGATINAITVIVIMCVGVVVIAIVLYGWVLPGFIWLAIVNAVPGTLGEILLPFGILAFIAFAGLWFTKGVEYFE